MWQIKAAAQDFNVGSRYFTQSCWAQTDGTEGPLASLLLQPAAEGISALKGGEAQALALI